MTETFADAQRPARRVRRRGVWAIAATALALAMYAALHWSGSGDSPGCEVYCGTAGLPLAVVIIFVAPLTWLIAAVFTVIGGFTRGPTRIIALICGACLLVPVVLVVVAYNAHVLP